MFDSLIGALFSLITAAIALLIVVDPLGNIPVFIGLTENMSNEQKKKTFNTAVIVSIVLLLIFALAGREIFNFFGVSIYAFQVAGGLLLLIMAIRILVSGSKFDNLESPEIVGAVPIAIPLLVGPGAITATMFNLEAYGVFITTLSVILVLAITWIILRSINSIYRFLGKTGSLVIARVMAIFIAAIAIQYILTGITHFLNV